jgi:Ca2+-binding EF-hand superfamily protein
MQSRNANKEKDKDYEFKKKKKIAENQKLLTPQQKEEIKKAFDFFDITGSGKQRKLNFKYSSQLYFP